jgi:hypothetical protein
MRVIVAVARTVLVGMPMARVRMCMRMRVHCPVFYLDNCYDAASCGPFSCWMVDNTVP